MRSDLKAATLRSVSECLLRSERSLEWAVERTLRVSVMMDMKLEVKSETVIVG